LNVKRSFVLAGTFVSLIFATALAQTTRQAPGKPMFTAIRRGNPAQAIKAAAAGANVPLWSSSFNYQGTNYPFTMVGTDPSTTNVTTNIQLVIIPVKFKFGSVVIAPGQTACNDTKTPIYRVKNSPLLKSFPFVAGTTNVGTTQYIDAFQRASFWNSVGSVSPNYHVKFSPISQKTVQTIVVPPAVGGILGTFCGSKKVGAVDINYFDAIANNLITTLAIPPTSLALFLDYDVFWTSGGGCCILGYHSTTVSNQTYAVASYSDPGIFGVPIQDIHALSHELGEWMDDPLINNSTPAWGNIGQVSGCQGNLEVGDPLTGTAFNTVLGGFTYHPQELVFFSWFSRQSPSIAVNGWYSFKNTFTTPAAACP
jgi:hypothetical protein